MGTGMPHRVLISKYPPASVRRLRWWLEVREVFWHVRYPPDGAVLTLCRSVFGPARDKLAVALEVLLGEVFEERRGVGPG